MDYNKDYYAILGVPRKASAEAIRNAYKTQAKKFHPDRNGGDPAAGRHMSAINEAYEVLSVPSRRRDYDLHRETRHADAGGRTEPEAPSRRNRAAGKQRKAMTVLVIALVVIVLALSAAFAWARTTRDALGGMAAQAEALARMRMFSKAYDTLEEFEQRLGELESLERIHIIVYEFDPEDSAYQQLRQYVDAGRYYEKGQYAIAKNKFTHLGDYLESRVLAEECRRLAQSG